MKVTLNLTKKTKGTVVYTEPETGEPPVLKSQYVQRWAAKKLAEGASETDDEGFPKSLNVTLEAA